MLQMLSELAIAECHPGLRGTSIRGTSVAEFGLGCSQPEFEVPSEPWVLVGLSSAISRRASCSSHLHASSSNQPPDSVRAIEMRSRLIVCDATYLALHKETGLKFCVGVWMVRVSDFFR
jgi:hypothetical protein